jgi:hypothetical protein
MRYINIAQYLQEQLKKTQSEGKKKNNAANARTDPSIHKFCPKTQNQKKTRE